MQFLINKVIKHILLSVTSSSIQISCTILLIKETKSYRHITSKLIFDVQIIIYIIITILCVFNDNIHRNLFYYHTNITYYNYF